MSVGPSVVPTVAWLVEEVPLQLASTRFSELRISHAGLVLQEWEGNDVVLVAAEYLFGDGPSRACLVILPTSPDRGVLLGEEGHELLRLDFATPVAEHLAEVPRFPNDVGGMCRLEVLASAGVVLVHWELGIIALDRSLDLCWRHDLDWNHRMVYLDDEQVWFDLMYEERDPSQPVGGRPWGYALGDGRELLDEPPPTVRN